MGGSTRTDADEHRTKRVAECGIWMHRCSRLRATSRNGGWPGPPARATVPVATWRHSGADIIQMDRSQEFACTLTTERRCPDPRQHPAVSPVLTADGRTCLSFRWVPGGGRTVRSRSSDARDTVSTGSDPSGRSTASRHGRALGGEDTPSPGVNSPARCSSCLSGHPDPNTRRVDRARASRVADLLGRHVAAAPGPIL